MGEGSLRLEEAGRFMIVVWRNGWPVARDSPITATRSWFFGQAEALVNGRLLQ